ncbi:MAG TPA: cysteine--tRNA ligase [Candidatus Limiplasma stercoravium]|nr:cysteine--tRNA ligase [Candidatus Limiplasma stercoravium]
MRIYNSMTRKKETFVPLQEGKVGIYACGPTVYNYFHIGNARPFIVFDVLRRYLEYRGYEVTFVQNFTDIDDKLIRRAAEENTTVAEVAEKYIREYFVDAKALGIRPATVHPRATEHIPQIIALIERLMAKGLAYVSNGDVYFRVRAFPAYGCLCGQNLEDLESGARVGVDEQKEDPLDFALWKAQKPGEPAWDSPWGPGRPGWHIECSAMSTTYLGETFDIHGGGKDLLFPHHENEIAQTSGATGKPYVRYWMHNGFINIDNEKMSKSKGNFFTVRDISKEFDLEAVRMFMLSAHYRSPINFSRDLIEAAQSSLERLYIARDQLAFLLSNACDAEPDEAARAFMEACDTAEARFVEAMDDDLNTADALAALFDLVREVHRLAPVGVSRQAVAHGQKRLTDLCGVLGLLMRQEDAVPAEVQALVDQRAQARRERNWALSDELRERIKALGYVLEDTKAGQKVRKAGA